MPTHVRAAVLSRGDAIADATTCSNSRGQIVRCCIRRGVMREIPYEGIYRHQDAFIQILGGLLTYGVTAARLVTGLVEACLQ